MTREDEWFAAALRAGAPSEDDTACIATPPYDAGRLWAFKFEEADDPHTAAHLADCAHCRRLTGAMQPMTVGAIDRLVGGRQPSRRRWLAVALPLGAAAAAGLWWAARPAAPRYVPGRLEGAAQQVRGADEQRIFEPQNTIRWTLIPAVKTPEVQATGELIGPSNTHRTFEPSVAATGAVHVNLPVAETLGTAYGTWRLRVGVSVGGATGWHDVTLEYRARP